MRGHIGNVDSEGNSDSLILAVHGEAVSLGIIAGLGNDVGVVSVNQLVGSIGLGFNRSTFRIIDNDSRIIGSNCNGHGVDRLNTVYSLAPAVHIRLEDISVSKISLCTVVHKSTTGNYDCRFGVILLTSSKAVFNCLAFKTASVNRNIHFGKAVAKRVNADSGFAFLAGKSSAINRKLSHFFGGSGRTGKMNPNSIVTTFNSAAVDLNLICYGCAVAEHSDRILPVKVNDVAAIYDEGTAEEVIDRNTIAVTCSILNSAAVNREMACVVDCVVRISGKSSRPFCIRICCGRCDFTCTRRTCVIDNKRSLIIDESSRCGGIGNSRNNLTVKVELYIFVARNGDACSNELNICNNFNSIARIGCVNGCLQGSVANTVNSSCKNILLRIDDNTVGTVIVFLERIAIILGVYLAVIGGKGTAGDGDRIVNIAITRIAEDTILAVESTTTNRGSAHDHAGSYSAIQCNIAVDDCITGHGNACICSTLTVAVDIYREVIGALVGLQFTATNIQSHLGSCC